MDEENEHIDPTQWLERSFAESYPFAFRKVMIVSNRMGTNYHSKNRLPVDILLDRGLITGEQHRTAMFITVTKIAIANAIGFDRVFRDIPVMGYEGVTVGISPSLMLEIALHGLNKWQKNIIDRITDGKRVGDDRTSRPMTNADVAWIGKCVTSVKESLGLVQKNIDEFKEKAKNSITQGGISVS